MNKLSLNRSKKSDNYLIGYIFTIFLLIANICNLSIFSLLIVFFISYLVFAVYCFKSLKSIKKVFLSAEFIFGTVFFAYAVPAAIMFLLDGYVPRISFFVIDTSTIFDTLKLYFNIYCVFVILLAITGGIHTMDYYTKEKDLKRKIYENFDIFDIIALVISVYFYYLHFRNGFSIFNLYFQDLRQLILSDIGNLNSYLYLYMIPYSFVNIYKYIYRAHDKNKKITYKELFVIIVLIMFWGLSLLTDRRNFINMLLMVILLYFYKLKKVDMKKVISLLLIVVIFLSISFFRSGTTIKDRNNILFLSCGEFILVNYVSNFYINNVDDLKYGTTYIWDTITSFIPREFYANKPVLLSQQFKEQANTNVSYAFNPVAEGLVNFGKHGAVFAVPLVILFFIKFAYALSKKHFLYYIIVCGESINFFRGIFSVSMFTIAIMIIVAMFMLSSISKNDRRLN